MCFSLAFVERTITHSQPFYFTLLGCFFLQINCLTLCPTSHIRWWQTQNQKPIKNVNKMYILKKS